MITPGYAQTLARYNGWMNDRIYAAADSLDDAERKADRGAYFGSVHATLNHLVWGDMTWLGRFVAGTVLAKAYPKAAVGTILFEDWEAMKTARKALDQDIIVWAAGLREDWLERDFSWYSAIAGTTRTRPAWLLVAHLFNHQAHHRGQVTTLLSQRGIDPGVTDLPFMPD